MDYSDYDYSEYDCLDEFTISDIAYGFSRIGKEKVQRASKRNIITDALKQAILKGRLISTLQINDESPDNPPIDWKAIRIQRNEIKKWFESKGQKPPFLFPEARNVESGSKPRLNQTEKAACQHEGKGIVRIHEPERKDDWFNVIHDAIKVFEKDKGHTPIKSELWGILVNNPPSIYGIEYDKTKKALVIPGSSSMDRENFNKRYGRYYPPLTDNNAFNR